MSEEQKHYEAAAAVPLRDAVETEFRRSIGALNILIDAKTATEVSLHGPARDLMSDEIITLEAMRNREQALLKRVLEEFDPDNIKHGSFSHAKAFFECGGCGKQFHTEIADGATKLAFFKDVMELMVDTVRWGHPDSTSVRGGFVLCAPCTSIVDADEDIPDGPDRDVTEAQVKAALGIDD